MRTMEKSPLSKDYVDTVVTDFEAQFDSPEIAALVERFERLEPTDDELEQMILDLPTEPQVSYPESNPDGTISESDYLARCRWRLGNISHALDACSANIDNEIDAAEWLELKKAILAAKSIGDAYAVIDPMIELEAAGYEFALRVGVDMTMFESNRNQ